MSEYLTNKAEVGLQFKSIKNKNLSGDALAQILSVFPELLSEDLRIFAKGNIFYSYSYNPEIACYVLTFEFDNMISLPIITHLVTALLETHQLSDWAILEHVRAAS